MCAAFCNTVGTTANSQPATSRPAISGVWWTCLLTIWTRSGVCPRPSASSWGIAAGLHIHVAVVGQGQGLLRRRRRLSGFGRLTEKNKKIIDKKEKLTGYLTSQHRAVQLDFSLYKEFHYLIPAARSRQNIVRSITHTWQGAFRGWGGSRWLGICFLRSQCSVCSHLKRVWPTTGAFCSRGKLHCEESRKECNTVRTRPGTIMQ